MPLSTKVPDSGPPKAPRSADSGIDIRNIVPPQGLESLGVALLLVRSNEEVSMAGHQYIGVSGTSVALRYLTEQIQVGLVIGGIKKQHLVIIPPLNRL